MTLIATLPFIGCDDARRRPRSIRARLMQIVFTLVVPGTIGFIILASSFYRHERDHIAQSTLVTARALVSAVDRDLVSTTVAAQILALSPNLQSEDFAAFHSEASKLIPLVFGSNFALADESGQQLVNTLTPYGEALPRYQNATSQRRVFETGKPVVSDVIISQLSNKPVIAIHVPVMHDGKVKYTLSVGVFPQRLNELLIRQKLPPNWIASVFDTSSVIVARTHNSERFSGRKASPMLLAAMAGTSSGVAETTTVEGISVFTAFTRSEVSGWTVAIGIPVAELSQGLNRLLLLGGAGAIGLLIVGLALAGFQSREIAHAVQDLIPPAQALGRGEVPEMPRLNVREADDVAQALGRAYQILQSRTVERDRAKLKEEQARVLTGMMDEFVANVSHELRTPLTSIAGSLGLLANGVAGALPIAAVRLIAIAHTNAQRLVRLVNDILDIGKIASGNMTFDFAPIDLRKAAGQAIDANRAFAEIHHASIRLDHASPDCVVRADADRLIQILTNLLSNAIKFSPHGGEVVVTIKRTESMGCLLVRDHGPGIPEQFKSRIFDKFAQAETGDARQKSGSGLGLNIVSKIVAQHGGIVGFDDAPGGGTVFHVEIPLWTKPAITAPAS
jgi:two-component system, sensor histidine kinase and response regulator